MITTIYWDKLRVLVTNKCNYMCPFCHNEGQKKVENTSTMELCSFISLMNILRGQELSEINFSGGEPFLNPYIVDMIEYANAHMNSDISCATNLSLITEEQIIRLAKTRVKLNVQFPYVKEEDFKRSTGNGDLNAILNKINLVRFYNIAIGLNMVVQSHNYNAVREMILFAIDNEMPLKLLPQIGLDGSDSFKKFIFPILHEYAIEYKDKGTGAIRWVLSKGISTTSVLFIDSPCFTHDIQRCKNYGEVRIHPNFMLQCCLLNNRMVQLDIDKGQEYVINQFRELWENFRNC